MEKMMFNEEQIAFALRQVETGTSVDEICTNLGITQTTFDDWKKKYGGLSVSDLRRLMHLETEVPRLGKLVSRLMVVAWLAIIIVSIYAVRVVLQS